MRTSSIFESLIGGLAAALFAALIIGAVAWAYSSGRNYLLEKKLKDAINPNGVGTEFRLVPLHAAFTLQIHNYANAAIRVRTVIFVADQFHLELEPEPNRKIDQTPLSNEALQAKFSRTRLSGGALTLDNNVNAVLLPSKTMATWRVPPESIGQLEWKIKDVLIVLEYATVFGYAAMIRISAPQASLDLIKSKFEPLSRAVFRQEPIEASVGSAAVATIS